MSTTAVICWEINDGRMRGHGSPINRESAEAWLRQLAKDCPDVKHWLCPERAPEVRS